MRADPTCPLAFDAEFLSVLGVVGYLALAERWALILSAMGKDPAAYRVACHTPAHGGEQQGHPRRAR